ncbi:hypothetical protein BT96DRAFT_105358 [Gymnopus androsaceus JB14]|uniref:Hydrophobin n=1 Tax=Gymnopus androsaceus JB14 TaxID=1447944 RepID=A0A6A4IEL8_9AGAR|nr:hypothetical protein BT96DRAFT_105358 [Gymnopus androsaceus JB14]
MRLLPLHYVLIFGFQCSFCVVSLDPNLLQISTTHTRLPPTRPLQLNESDAPCRSLKFNTPRSTLHSSVRQENVCLLLQPRCRPSAVLPEHCILPDSAPSSSCCRTSSLVDVLYPHWDSIRSVAYAVINIHSASVVFPAFQILICT